MVRPELDSGSVNQRDVTDNGAEVNTGFDGLVLMSRWLSLQ